MCEIVWIVCCVKNLHKLFMCEWNDEIWIIIVYVWTDLKSLNILNRLNRFLNRLNRFLNRFYVWTGWTNFFIKFLWNLNRFCCCFLSRLNRFCVNRLNIFFYEVFVKFELILLLFFKHIEQIFLWSFGEIFWTDFVIVFWWDWTDFMCEYWIGWTIFLYKKNRIFNVSNRPNRLKRADQTAPL